MEKVLVSVPDRDPEIRGGGGGGGRARATKLQFDLKKRGGEGRAPPLDTPRSLGRSIFYFLPSKKIAA